MKWVNTRFHSAMTAVVAAVSLVVGMSSAQKGSIDSFSDSTLYKSLETIDSKTLLREADANMRKDTLLDRAAVALSIVANRYYRHQNDTSVRHDATIAMRKLGNFYMRVVDFNKSYKNLMKARQIAEEDGNQSELAYIFLALANLYYDSSDYGRMKSKAGEYLAKGFEMALKGDDQYIRNVIAVNMATEAFFSNGWGIYGQPISEYRQSMPKDKSGVMPQFAGLTIDACDAYLKGDYNKAENLLIRANTIMDDSAQGKIFKYNTGSLLAMVYSKTGEYNKAIATVKSDMEDAERNGFPNHVLSMHDTLSRLYREAGKSDSADAHYVKYLKQKADLEQNAGYNGIESMDFLSRIDEINDEVEQLSLKRQEERRQRVIVYSVLIVLIVVFLSLLLLYINLRRSHRELFRQNEEILNGASRQKLLREQLEEDNRRIAEELKTYKEASVSCPSNNEKEEGKKEEKCIPEADEELRAVYAAVLKVMEESAEIYQPGFSLNDLAGKIGVSFRTVSKAINTLYNGGFHQLHNEYRIRKVTTMMHSPEYANLTIESIAEMAGFQSRSTFSHLFKRVTGLTPGAYMRLAKESKG